VKDLPQFKHRKHEDVLAFISKILINEISDETHLIELLDYEDGHFRVLFKPSYFVLQKDQTEPTKSQWNSLKKKVKRHEPTAFVFKEHGEVGTKDKQYYLDFGFLPELPPMDKRRQK
jgi:hypothetical protein